VAKGKAKRGRLSVFKGREAKLNKAIFHILALKGPQTIYSIYKEIKSQKGLKHIRYPSVNKRVRSLEELGYVKGIGVKKTKAGFEAHLYELSARAYLAITLNVINLDDLLMRMDEANALAILAVVAYAK
jgi:DNA-binding Lrp family transcriptional regulator